MNIALLFCNLVGLYCILSSLMDNVPMKIKTAVKKRSSAGLGDIQVFLNKYAVFLSKKIKIPSEKKKTIEKKLHILNEGSTAEFYYADIIVTAAFYLIVGLATIIFSVWFGLVTAILIFAVTFIIQLKTLDKKLKLRKLAIEKELPQFAGTIKQQLSTTRDIVTILSSYQKICGETLKEEITKTINDLKMTNTEKALQNLERRIGSSKLSEVTRGLVGVYHGEEQTVFFELLTEDLIKAQTEQVIRDLEERPGKMTINFGAVIAAVILMAIAAIVGGIGDTNIF